MASSVALAALNGEQQAWYTAQAPHTLLRFDGLAESYHLVAAGEPATDR